MTLTATLQLQCPDQPGIVFRVTEFLFARGANILNLQQHCEELDGRFFMRVVFDFSAARCSRVALQEELAGLASEFEMETRVTFSDVRPRMAVMVSRTDHCLYELLLRHQYGELPVDVACVIGNHAELQRVAEPFGVRFFYVPVEADARHAAEVAQLALLREHVVDFVVMARYMQILSPEFIAAFPFRILNIHHGFLPAFKGGRPYHQAYERGVKLIGATAHYATEQLDDGPIIEQQTVGVSHIHSVQALISMGREIERTVLARAVAAHAEDRVMVYQNRTIVFE